MKDERGGCDVRNSNILEELGQIHFIFSDKTGTLTQNKMIFKQFSVGNRVYHDEDKNEEVKNHLENVNLDLKSDFF